MDEPSPQNTWGGLPCVMKMPPRFLELIEKNLVKLCDQNEVYEDEFIPDDVVVNFLTAHVRPSISIYNYLLR